MQLRHIAALAALLLSTPAMAVYKCKDQYGRTIYQDSACTETQQAEKINTTPATGRDRDAERANKHIQQMNNLNAAINTGLAIGLTSDQAQGLFGTPNTINRTTTQHGVNEQWVYEQGYARVYIYLKNNVVTSTQN